MFNEEKAVRNSELIVSATKGKKGKGRYSQCQGKGRYKCWTALAILKVCFERRSTADVAKVKAKANAKLAAGPLVGSVRQVSDQSGGSHGHVQKVRNAVAQLIMEAQWGGLANVCQPEQPHEAMIFDLRMDETHFEVGVSNPDDECAEIEKGSFACVMMKGSLTWLPASATGLLEHGMRREESIIVPPAYLSTACDAECLLGALTSKFGMTVDDARLRTSSQRVGWLVGVDSHKANDRLLKALQSSLVSKQQEGCQVALKTDLWKIRCFMHQLQIPHKDIYLQVWTSFHNELFCLAHLTRIGKDIMALRQCMQAIIREDFSVTFSEPVPACNQFSAKFLEMTFLTPSCVHGPVGEDEIDQYSTQWHESRLDPCILYYFLSFSTHPTFLLSFPTFPLHISLLSSF